MGLEVASLGFLGGMSLDGLIYVEVQISLYFCILFRTLFIFNDVKLYSSVHNMFGSDVVILG